MVTFKAVIFEHHKKKDNTWNVKIRLTHNRKIRYIDTTIFVVKAQMNKKFELKDDHAIDSVNDILKSYRKEVGKLGMKAFSMDVDDIKSFLIRKFESTPEPKDDQISFITFARRYITKIKAEGRDSKAMTYSAVINSIVDYFKSDQVDISQINYKFLVGWESFLKSERKMEMSDQFGKIRTITKPPATDAGVFHYMKELRTFPSCLQVPRKPQSKYSAS